MRSQLELVSVQLMLASKNTADSNRADDMYPHDELRAVAGSAAVSVSVGTHEYSHAICRCLWFQGYS